MTTKPNSASLLNKATQLEGLIEGAVILDNEGGAECRNSVTSILSIAKREISELVVQIDPKGKKFDY